MPLVSIIMPVYNVEEYLASSIDSVLAQSAKDFELLLINDGSKDRSLEICNEYAQKDSRIRVLDKPNGGVSSARNMGLDEAKGEWIMFVDSDDWLTADALSTCLEYTPEYDVIRFSYRIIRQNYEKNVLVKSAKSTEQFLRYQIERRTPLAVWGALFRRSLFTDNKIYFDPQFSYGEDWLVSMRLTLCSKNIKTLPGSVCYIYNALNMSSCTNTLSPSKVVQQLQVLKVMRGLLGDKYSKYRRSIRDTRCNVVRDMLRAFSPEESCSELALVRNKIDFIDRWDVLISDISIRKKATLFKFLRYCRAHGLR